MKPFERLTPLGQVRRLRRLAQSALLEYGLGGARLRFVAQSENTTFRVDVPGDTQRQAMGHPYVANRYLLRIHRRGYQTSEAIASEMAWLWALRQDADLPVPEPVPALDGELWVEAAAPGVPEPRACSLLRWMRGRLIRQRFQPHHFEALGRLMACLHDHAVQWDLPPDFTRRHWDWEGLFGDGAGFNLPASQVWALVPQAYHDVFDAVARQTQRTMESLRQGPDVFGLIHADLFLGAEGNVLFSGGQARPVDFDDCGLGYWAYDLAVPLCHWQQAEGWPSIRDALLDGYARIRPLPEDQLACLDLFMAARHVSEVLWGVDMAQVNSAFQAELDGWLAWAARHVRAFLYGAQQAAG